MTMKTNEMIRAIQSKLGIEQTGKMNKADLERVMTALGLEIPAEPVKAPKTPKQPKKTAEELAVIRKAAAAKGRATVAAKRAAFLATQNAAAA
jgi:hypothetical protein